MSLFRRKAKANAEKGEEKTHETWMTLTTKDLKSKENFLRVQEALSSVHGMKLRSVYLTEETSDQNFDEKTDSLTIQVDCYCSPEKVMDKLYTKGRGVIKRIVISDPPKPAPAPAETGQSSQPHPASMYGQPAPWYNGHNPVWSQLAPAETGQNQPAPWYSGHNPVWSQLAPAETGPSQPAPWSHGPNGYDERPIYDSYGGSDDKPSCSIM